MRIGQPVKLTADVYGNKVDYHGKVAGFGAGTGAAFSLLPAQNATGNWIKIVQRVPVRIALDPQRARGASAARRPVDGRDSRRPQDRPARGCRSVAQAVPDESTPVFDSARRDGRRARAADHRARTSGAAAPARATSHAAGARADSAASAGSRIAIALTVRH